MKNQKIVYVGNKLEQKGITVTSIETLGRFLSLEGYHVVTTSSVKNKVLRIFDMLWTIVRHAKTVHIVIIDTYSTQNFYFAVAVANMCRLLKIPYVPILRGGNLPNRLKKSKSQSRKLFHGAQTNVAPSHYLLEAFKQEGYTNLTYIPNTIELEKYPFLLRKELQPKLLWVRSFAEIYNPLLTLKVLESLLPMYPKATLCMIGPEKDGSLEMCRNYANENKLPVTFTGKLSKADWVAASKEYHIFINTTNFDNTPVSVIEGMALGLPIVSTHVGGVPYLIKSGIDGLLVPPNSVAAFVQAIKKLLDNHTFAETLSIAAREKVTAFDWQKVKQEWIALLEN